jgi:hypothetical protein
MWEDRRALISFAGLNANPGDWVLKTVLIDMEKPGDTAKQGYIFVSGNGGDLAFASPNGVNIVTHASSQSAVRNIQVGYARENGTFHTADPANAYQADRFRVRVDFEIQIPPTGTNLLNVTINNAQALGTGLFARPSHALRLADIDMYGLQNTAEQDLQGDINKWQSVIVRKLDPNAAGVGTRGMHGTLLSRNDAGAHLPGTDIHTSGLVPAFRFTNTDFEIRTIPVTWWAPAPDVGMVNQPSQNALRFTEPWAATGTGSIVSRWNPYEVVSFTLVDEDDNPLVDANGQPTVKLYAFGFSSVAGASGADRNGNINLNIGTHVINSNAYRGQQLQNILSSGNNNVIIPTGNQPWNNNNNDWVWLVNNKDSAVRNSLNATDFFFSEDGQTVSLSGLNKVDNFHVGQIEFYFTLSISPNFKGGSVRVMVEGSGLADQAGSYKLTDVRRRVEVDVENTTRINITQTQEARVGSITITENRQGALLVAPNYVLDMVYQSSNTLTNNTRTATNHFRFVDSTDRLKLDIKQATGDAMTSLIANVSYPSNDGVLLDGILRVNNSINLKVTNRSDVASHAHAANVRAQLTISGFYVIVDRFVNEGHYFVALGTNDNYGRYLHDKTPILDFDGTDFILVPGSNVIGNYVSALYDRTIPVWAGTPATIQNPITNNDALKLVSNSQNVEIVSGQPNWDYINNNVTRTEVLLTSTAGNMWYRFYDWGFNSNDVFITVQNPHVFNTGLRSPVSFIGGQNANDKINSVIVEGVERILEVINADGSKTATPIVYIGGTNYVPVRALAEMFGLEMGRDIIQGGKDLYIPNDGSMTARWFDVVTIYANGSVIKFYYDQSFYVKDNIEYKFTPGTEGHTRTTSLGFNFNDASLHWRLYLPLGEFLNALSIPYSFDPATRLVLINPSQSLTN